MHASDEEFIDDDDENDPSGLHATLASEQGLEDEMFDDWNSGPENFCLECGVSMGRGSMTRQLCGKTHCDGLGH